GVSGLVDRAVSELGVEERAPLRLHAQPLRQEARRGVDAAAAAGAKVLAEAGLRRVEPERSEGGVRGARRPVVTARERVREVRVRERERVRDRDAAPLLASEAEAVDEALRRLARDVEADALCALDVLEPARARGVEAGLGPRAE